VLHATPLPQAAAPRLEGLSETARAALARASHALHAQRFDAARQALAEAAALAPGHPEPRRAQAIIELQSGHPGQAVATLRGVLADCPDYALAHADLGTALQATGATAEALAAWRQACTLAPDAPMPWFNLGRALQLEGSTGEAIKALERSIALAPDFLPALILAGDAQVHAGRFEAAERHYRAAIALHGACGDAWRGLANIKTRPLDAGDRARLAGFLATPDTAPADRIAIGFALGKALEDAGEYPAAFAALQQANTELGRIRPWRARGFHAWVEAIAAAAVQLAAPPEPTLGQEVIFIVGLPRSGSTLFEQILAAHPEVEGASELSELEQVLGEECARRRQQLPDWIGAASGADWQRLGRRYLELTRRWRQRRPRHTDKLPSNWVYTPILAAMLPGARIVDARRDALEAGWSCYKQQFYRLPHFACALEDIAAYAGDCERLMDRWRAATPERVHLARYEALQADPDGEIRALLAFCALPFDAACLDFRHAGRAVRTASAAQVREPLARDTRRADRYGALLDPLRRGLGRAPFGT